MPSSARLRTGNLARMSLIALALPLFSACMNMEAVIRVMPDGSGTVERNLVITNDLLMGFLEEMGGTEDFDVCGSPEELAAMAERMGEGVASSRPSPAARASNAATPSSPSTTSTTSCST